MDMRKTDLPRVEVRDAKPARAARPRLWRRLLLLAVAVLVAAAAAWWFYGRGIAVATVAVTRGTAAEIVYGTGAVEPLRWARVATLIQGRIVERCRCEGREVKTGHVLAVLDDREAQATLRELRAREEFDRREVERQRQLSARNVTTTQALERAESDLMRTQALISAQVQRIEQHRLVSPMDGVVLREDGEVGEVVNSNTILYLIGLPHPLQLVASVNEEDIPRVAVGQTVLLRTDAFADRRLTGTVHEITPAGDPVARTFRIRVALPEDTPLRVGMNVEANVVTREKSDVLLAPATAIAQNAAFIVADGRAVRRPVEIGLRGPQMVEITSGLTEGDRLVAPIPSELRDGSRVRVTGEAAATRR
jgi:membrane fusion protein, multidrug efflux system